LTLYLSLFAGGASFLLTAAESLGDITDFHGSATSFLVYLLENLSFPLYNGIMAFCLCALVSIIPLTLLEKKMREFEEKSSAKQEASKKTGGGTP
jgi:hypothetical protein